MKKLFKIVGWVLLFCFLTILTQIGGIVLLLSLWISKFWKKEFKFKLLLIFLVSYLFITFLIVPFVAPIFGREKIRHSEKIKPTNYISILLNRNYVVPKLNNLLSATALRLKDSEIEISYLDANFPFINKFPLLPHLSHNDGKKIDISLIYEAKNGKISNKQKSISGYGVFEKPKENEYNQIKECKSNGYFQYDYPKYLTFGKINSELWFSERGTKKLINFILKNNGLGKMFIEPHLKSRLKLTNSKIRYHGCRAVRHDDHIHIQLK
ncbi:MAG: hypothetical protein COA97_11590 [Flavobacteriales bacterium]|nr:MAG: hypothetical protein COA97_11590 [Flavobacteriales bacterium]